VTRFGLPIAITSDGTFDSKAMMPLCELLSARSFHISIPHSPTGHECVECHNNNRVILEGRYLLTMRSPIFMGQAVRACKISAPSSPHGHINFWRLTMESW